MIPPSGEQHELRYEDQRAVVVEVGGGLRAYDRVLDGYELDEMCASARGAVLMPWPNRIPGGRYVFDGVEHRLPVGPDGSALHGLVRWASWRAVEREDARVLMEHVLHPQPGYPFTLLLRVEYRLDGVGLTVRTTAENVGREACPFGAGHHPYVAGRVDAAVDDTQHCGGAWSLRHGDVVVWADDAWPYAQLYSGADRADVAQRSLAVEPMTCPPNAFNTGEGLIRLEPGQRFQGTWGITR